MLKYNIRVAFRNLLRLKSHTIISLIGLIIALACVFVVLAWTIQEQQYDRFHKESTSIYMITTDIIDNNEVANRYPDDFYIPTVEESNEYYSIALSVSEIIEELIIIPE